MDRRFAWLLVLTWAVPLPARADVKPHALCTDGMVLQQQMDVNLWGTANKGEKVTVVFRGKTATTTADDHGRWKVTLPSGPAGGPLTMTITGTNELKYENVYVGEVWVCSGQSNMQWEIFRCGPTDQKIAKESPPTKTLRLFQVPRVPQAQPIDDIKAKWTDANPETLQQFSGTAYFFGRDLHAALKVPVGLI
ncbi:MAG: hypothetical protein NZO58_04470, partial [Gemmataceae bacterium]|nr:hypothetical protein [Gemmataceae bacterium]